MIVAGIVAVFVASCVLAWALCRTAAKGNPE